MNSQNMDAIVDQEYDIKPYTKARPIFLGAAIFEAGQGGIARVARMTAKTLVASGYDIETLSLLDDRPVRFGKHKIHMARGSQLRFAAHCHVAAIKAQHFIYDSSGVARAHASLGRLRRPYAVWMHGIEVWQGLKRSSHAALKAADLRIANSKFTLNKYLELHGDLANAQICWLATEEDDPPAAMPDFSGPPTVLILGTIDGSLPYKGHVELVSCWRAVASAVPDARLLIAGAGSGLANLIASAKASGVPNNIEFTGFVREQDLPSLWRRTHVFAMPSRNEGFGIVYAEAMRHGVPVIASVHDAAQEINMHERTGYNVDLDRRGELAESLISLLRSPDLIRKMGQAGHERWRECFRFSAFHRRLAPIIQGFVGGMDSRPPLRQLTKPGCEIAEPTEEASANRSDFR
jgi:phosphatidyl-myo-inositol dimannoside synthase